MSFTSVNLKTDFDKIYDLFVTLFKHEPSWVAVAETDLSFAAPSINKLITLVSLNTNVDPVIANTIAAIQADLILAIKFIQNLDVSKNLTDVLNSLISNLQGLLTLGGVKSNSAINEITAIVNSLVTEIKTILNSVPKA